MKSFRDILEDHWKYGYVVSPFELRRNLMRDKRPGGLNRAQGFANPLNPRYRQNICNLSC